MSTTVPSMRPPQSTQGRHLLWLGGLVFLLAYLAVDVTHGLLATASLPMPDAADADVIAYYTSERTAVVVASLCHLVSVAGLALFWWKLGRIAAPDRYRTAAGAVAIGSLVASALLGTAAALVASSSPDTALLLRDLNFYTGGVVHVVALGALVAAVVWRDTGKPLLTRPVRWLGIVAACCALLSVLSVAVYYAAVFLPLGRVLSMIWTVAAGVSIARRHR